MSVLERADPALAEAIEVAEWDCYFICAKLYRAMSGRDEAQHSQERDQDDDHLQSDWNGSAKVALISIVRSTEAWTLIGHATGDPDASAIADLFAQLRRQVEEAFPDAWKFVRPGFDTEK